MFNSVFSAQRGDWWAKVDEAVEKGLPQTAIESLEPIIQSALEDRAYAEAVKAIAKRIVLEGMIQGNRPEEKIVRMDAELAQAPPEIAPLLETLQALWYWQYFEHNSWRFMQRTATAEAPGKDFTTWDLPRLFVEIDKHFSAALGARDSLRQTLIESFDDLLEKGIVPDVYRPTLYDFIAHEALRFYSCGEQAAAQPQDAFTVSAADPVFDSAKDFMRWNPQTTDTESSKLKAIRLHQELLEFHEKDKNPSAFADADLTRLDWAFNTAAGEDKSVRYRKALEAFIENWKDHEISALARHKLAEALYQADDFVEAHRIATRGTESFPESIGANLCRSTLEKIEEKSFSIECERVWNAPWPELAISYRNIEEAHFRLIKTNWEKSLNAPQSSEYWLDQKPDREWSLALPATADYKTRTERKAVPDDLEPGFYMVLASHRSNFPKEDNQVSMTSVWIGDLALVMRQRDHKTEGFVLDARSGEPIEGASVMAWVDDERGRPKPLDQTAQTDANGLFVFGTLPEYRNATFRARAKINGVRHELASDSIYASGHWRNSRDVEEQTFFFTDRSIYRPGQTIHYKGICVHIDTTKDNYRTLADRNVEVAFEDTNGAEIEVANHTTNNYGSFSGAFVAPRDRLMGNMTLRIRKGCEGRTSISVEEYKRPKFKVELDAPKQGARLNESVLLLCRAEAYTGASVDGADVRWRVVRETRWPWWCFWRSSSSQEISNGTGKTDAKGAFEIQFNAKPDPEASEDDETWFSFTVYADVTDSAGETRSDQRAVRIGFRTMKATMSAEEWQTASKPVEIQIRATTLDDEPQKAKGVAHVHALKQPEKVHRAPLAQNRWHPNNKDQNPDLTDPNQWELAEAIKELTFETNEAGVANVSVALPPGVFRVVLETNDRLGGKVTAQLPLTIVDPDAAKLNVKIPQFVAAESWRLEPGQTLNALWGTGYEKGRAFIEILHRDKFVKRYWTYPNITQQRVQWEVTEAMRGGFTVHITQVRENRAYMQSRRVDVPWSNKNLKVRWERFTSKLNPGQSETWTAVVSGSDTEKAAVEMAAALYDASLDQFRSHGWPHAFGFFRRDYSSLTSSFQNTSLSFSHLVGAWSPRKFSGPVWVSYDYRRFHNDLIEDYWGYRFMKGGRRMRGEMATLAMAGDGAMEMAEAAPQAEGMPPSSPAPAAIVGKVTPKKANGGNADDEKLQPSIAPSLDQVTARKNLNETAFFMPRLIAGQDGAIRIEFTMPEALTTWKFMGFAHDRQCRSGLLTDTVVTSKDLMVQPNPPRFLREGDELEFSVKITNRSAESKTGRVKLFFANLETGDSADTALSNSEPERDFEVSAGESRSLAWRILVPDGQGFLSYKAVALSGDLSDGEEGALPILSRRILAIESLPLPIRGPLKKEFRMTKLLESGASDTLRHESFTAQMVSNPAWYAVMALPYLMEFPHECSEQVFNRLYANLLAAHIAGSDPKIRAVFDQWKGTDALDSPLEKNENLKAVMLEETPWLRDAKNESQARRNVGILFDSKRLENETRAILRKLGEMQFSDGSWPWFPGGHANDFITLYIVTGFGRLRHLDVDTPMDMAMKSLERLDEWMDENYRDIRKSDHWQDYVPSSTDALYLYGRSFFLKDRPIEDARREAVDFFLDQARKVWLKTDRQSQGHLALALKRFGDDKTAKAIMRSIKERSVTDEEMGMFWREAEMNWWWYRAPIETQALMIEAFEEVMDDSEAVESCRVWLLKQKQTQNWKTTKATADAVYSLLLRGSDILADDELVQMTLGDLNITPEPGAEGVEAGTGFYEKRFGLKEIQPDLGRITVDKKTEGTAWGSAHWRYLEDMAKISPHEGTPLKLKKTIYIRESTKKGLELKSIEGAVGVGDELIVRVELRTDRDMEFVHLKDQRPSGSEPVNVLSGYRYQDGLAYYESTRDTASHFFIDYLPKGTYVFEYAARIQHRGRYQTGIAEIQCMYAPEFNSHSESFVIEAK